MTDDELAKLRKEAQEAIAQGADPEQVRHEFRRLAALLPEPPDAPAPHEGAQTGLGAAARSLAATGANLAHGIPGMEAAQAGIRGLVRGQSYGDALSDIRGETGKIPTPLRIAGQLPGVVAATGLTPSLSAAKVGGLYGGAQQALSADPMPLKERAARTVAGAAAGAFIPKVIEGLATTGRIASTGVRAAMTKTTPAMLLQNQEAALQQETAPMYEQALQEGRGAVVPPQVRAFLDRPEIKDISGRLQQLDKFKGMADDSPEMLQAIDRALSDQSIALRNPANLVAQGKGATNVGRAELDQVRGLKQALADAIGTPGQLMRPNVGTGSVTTPPMMPSQVAANRAFATGKGLQEATRRGVDAVAAAQRGTTPGGGLRTRSPEAFERWARTQATPAELDAFVKSVMGETGAKVRSGALPHSGLDIAMFPMVYRSVKAARAGDRMLRAAKGLPRSTSVSPAITPSLLDILNEYTRR